VPGVVNDRRYRVCMLIRAVIPFGGMCEVGSAAGYDVAPAPNNIGRHWAGGCKQHGEAVRLLLSGKLWLGE